MKKITVYFNEHSSNASLLKWKSELEDALYRYDVRFKVPISLDSLASELRKDVFDGVESIIGIGGDGTANKIIQEIAGTNIKLFFIPAGTANDLCNQLNISGDADSIIDIFKTEATHKIDTIKINDCFMATNGGLGLPNLVAERINLYRHKIPGFKRLMKKLGGKVYSLMLAIELFTGKFKRYPFEIKCDEIPVDICELEASMLLINNQAVLGNSFKIAPETKNNDGSFNVTILSHPTKLGLLKSIVMVKLGKIPKGDPHFITFETSKISIKSLGEAMVFFGDGEQLTKSSHFDISVCHENLELITMLNGQSEVDRGISLDTITRL